MSFFFSTVIFVSLVGAGALWWLASRSIPALDRPSDVLAEIEAARKELQCDYAIVGAGGTLLGLSSDEDLIIVRTPDGTASRLPYNALRAVTLTPTLRSTSVSAGQSRTRRGSQLIGAGAGAALAGPVGALIGGLSGPQQHETKTHSSDHITTLELELFFRDDGLPRVSVVATGNYGALPVKQDAFKDIAARLANIAERNTITPRM
ncbi:hypothetical protein H8M03_09675 [Sphingomonas sabuli]|uniref:Uncharacterized protein n=1 Tax=Sphingomonas sabuli TaxID=2764186 RepID=A0A7G9L0Y3_9SPHN|nr:hypothetical protein [Sphingomonas sabuli]QNM82282.1 hypothetical protein H8M03_09675 [Sphingomonas sabuli]